MAQDFVTHDVVATDGAAVVALANEMQADLVVIGPEGPLVAGVADALRAADIAVFGPSAAAARLEGSKTFAKDVMLAAGVPTAAARTCRTMAQVQSAMDEFGSPYVVKDDGLAAGKGVVVTLDEDIARDHAARCLAEKDRVVVVEEFLDGPEVSLFAVTDGTTVVPLAPAQDFKRVGDADTGPNTGGMGAYSPLPWAPEELTERVLVDVLQPTIDEMARRGTMFTGLLYAGLALTSRGVRVIEFNARFGDPETQVVLARLATPLHELLFAAATNNLHLLAPLRWREECAVTVVMAAQDYPGEPRLGAIISGLDGVSGARVFHAGTSRSPAGEVVVSGGRVLSVTALGEDLAQARRHAYEAVSQIRFAGEHHRSDIALLAANGQIEVP